MAITTANTKLYYDSGTDTWVELTPIISYPDLGSTPAKIDTTDLSQTVYKTSMLGLQEIPDLIFECNYDKGVFDLIAGLTGKQKLKLEFGDAGVDGIFKWEGEIKIYINGGGVDVARKMQVTCSAGTPIVKS